MMLNKRKIDFKILKQYNKRTYITAILKLPSTNYVFVYMNPINLHTIFSSYLRMPLTLIAQIINYIITFND